MLRFYCHWYWYWYLLFPHLFVVLTHVQPGSNKKVIKNSFKVGMSIFQEETYLSVVNGLGAFGELAICRITTRLVNSGACQHITVFSFLFLAWLSSFCVSSLLLLCPNIWHGDKSSEKVILQSTECHVEKQIAKVIFASCKFFRMPGKPVLLLIHIFVHKTEKSPCSFYQLKSTVLLRVRDQDSNCPVGKNWKIWLPRHKWK